MKDVIQLNLQFITDKIYDPSFDLLMDFRDSTALAFKIDLADFFDFFKKNVVLKKKIRNGILFSTTNQKFLIAFYKPTARLLKIEVEDFTDLKVCLDWMKYSESQQVIVNEALKSLKIRTQV